MLRGLAAANETKPWSQSDSLMLLKNQIAAAQPEQNHVAQALRLTARPRIQHIVHEFARQGHIVRALWRINFQSPAVSTAVPGHAGKTIPLFQAGEYSLHLVSQGRSPGLNALVPKDSS